MLFGGDLFGLVPGADAADALPELPRLPRREPVRDPGNQTSIHSRRSYAALGLIIHCQYAIYCYTVHKIMNNK